MNQARNHWEEKRLRDCTTIERVTEEIRRCEHGRVVAANASTRQDWMRKVTWLKRLKRKLQSSAGVPPASEVES